VVSVHSMQYTLSTTLAYVCICTTNPPHMSAKGAKCLSCECVRVHVMRGYKGVWGRVLLMQYNS
jgi:hypothetical protein